MEWRKLKAAAVALPVIGLLVVGRPDPLHANDGERILKGLLGTGIGIILNEAQGKQNEPIRRDRPEKKAASPERQAKRSEPKLTADQVFVIQFRLNELGYNVGIPDGGLGDDTRRGIRRYQENMGAPPTGYLSSAQVKSLLDGQPSAIAIANGNPDLLAPSEMEQFQKALKRQGYKIGKIDGISGPATGRAIAKFLADRGYDADQTSVRAAYELALNGDGGNVVADGKGIATTGAAGDERSLFGSMPASEGELAAADAPSHPAGATIDPGAYVLPGESSGLDLDRELARRALHSIPSLADDPDIVRAWFREDHSENDHFYKRDASEIAKLYWEGTQFDKEDALKQFRAGLPSQAIGDELKVVLTLEAELRAKYDPAKGFPLKIENSANYSIKQFEIYNQRVGADMILLLPDAPELGWIPVTDEPEARRIASAIKDNSLSKLTVTMLVSIKRVGPETAGAKGDLSGYGILTEATLDGLSISGKDVELYRWNLPSESALAGTTGGGMDAASFARFADIPFLGGYLAIYDSTAHLELPGSAKFSAHRTAWQRFVDMTRLAVHPSLLENDEMAIGYAAIALSDADKVRLSEGKDIFENSLFGGWRNLDEFERRGIIERLRTGYIGKITSKIPRVPVPVVHIRAIGLSNYDFDNQQFSIAVNDSSSRNPEKALAEFLSNRSYGGIEPLIDHGLRAYPEVLKIDPAKAEFLVKHLKEKGREKRVYLAIFSNVSVVADPTEAEIGYKVEPTRLALFSDLGLSELIQEFSLDDYAKAPPAPVDPAFQRVADIFALKATPSHVFAREAENYPASKGYLEAYLKSASSYRSADEFGREEALAAVRKAVDEVDRGRTDLWLSGTIKLGEYNTAKGGFAAVSISLASGRSEIDSFGAELEHKVFNVNDLAVIPVDRGLAEKAVKAVPSREFEVRARVKPVGAAWDREKNAEAYPEVVFEQQVVELYVLFDGDEKSANDRAILAHLIPGEPKSAQGTAANTNEERPLAERPIISQDLLLTIATKDRLESLSERSMTWLLTNRWLNDNLVVSTLPARFFDKAAAPPNAATAPSYVEPFKHWAKSLRTEMPKKVTLVWERDSPTASTRELIVQRCHYLSAAGADSMFPQRMGLPPSQELFQKQVNGPLEGTADEPVVMKPAYLGFGKNSAFACAESEPDREWAPRIVVVLDRLPMPPRGMLGNLAEIDAIIEKVTPFDNGNDLPSLRVDVTFEEARFLDFRKADAAAAPQVSLLKVVKAAEMDAAAAAVNDANASLDVLGITLGQSFEEADRILATHFTKPHIVDSVVGYSAAPASFQSARVYLRQDGREFVALFYEPSINQKTVVAVYRNLVAPLGEFDAKDVLVSVRSKYGTEALNKSNNNGLELFWGQHVAKKSRGGNGPPEETDCKIDMGQHYPGAWIKDGQRLDTLARLMPWEEVRDHGFMSWPRLDRPEDMKRYEKCGAFLRVKHFSWKMNGMSTFLVDIKAYQEAFANARKQSEEEVNSDVKGSGEKSKLKL